MQGQILTITTVLFRPEYDIFRRDRSCHTAGGCLVSPVEICVRDNLIRRRRSPMALVLRTVGIGYQSHVVTSDKSTM